MMKQNIQDVPVACGCETTDSELYANGIKSVIQLIVEKNYVKADTVLTELAVSMTSLSDDQSAEIKQLSAEIAAGFHNVCTECGD